MNRILMAPGPTELPDAVLEALSRQPMNPDIDPDYIAFYAELCNKLQRLLGTRNDCLVLSGEGILGLEAACASLIEPGMKVLCLANGIFGAGFAGFIRAYGGEPIMLEKDFRQGISGTEVRELLNQHPDIKVATMVHCDTPSGLLNPIEEICPVLKEHGVISVVDAVASIAGDRLLVDEWGIDMVLGGSQKALSAPAGLTFLSVSEAAWRHMRGRTKPPAGLYLNLLTWHDSWLKDRSFPYTQPVNEHYALNAALDLALQEGEHLFERHKHVASATRSALRKAGFDVFPAEKFAASTVTALSVPESIDDKSFRDRLWQEYGVLIAGSWGELSGKIWRIGHMGSQCYPDKVRACLEALERCLSDFGYQTEVVKYFTI